MKVDVSSVSRLSERMAKRLETSAFKLCGGQFALSSQLILINYPLHQRATLKFSAESNPGLRYKSRFTGTPCEPCKAILFGPVNYALSVTVALTHLALSPQADNRVV